MIIEAIYLWMHMAIYSYYIMYDIELEYRANGHANHCVVSLDLLDHFFGLSPCAVVFAAQADIRSTVVEITDHRAVSTLGALFVGGA